MNLKIIIKIIYNLQSITYTIDVVTIYSYCFGLVLGFLLVYLLKMFIKKLIRK